MKAISQEVQTLIDNAQEPYTAKENYYKKQLVIKEQFEKDQKEFDTLTKIFSSHKIAENKEALKICEAALYHSGMDIRYMKTDLIESVASQLIRENEPVLSKELTEKLWKTQADYEEASNVKNAAKKLVDHDNNKYKALQQFMSVMDPAGLSIKNPIDQKVDATLALRDVSRREWEEFAKAWKDQATEIVNERLIDQNVLNANETKTDKSLQEVLDISKDKVKKSPSFNR